MHEPITWLARHSRAFEAYLFGRRGVRLSAASSSPRHREVRPEGKDLQVPALISSPFIAIQVNSSPTFSIPSSQRSPTKMTPNEPPSSTSRSAFRASIVSTASPQLTSPFFAFLPREIRDLIYIELWKTSSLRRHITAEKVAITTYPAPPEQVNQISWHHVPCRTDPTAEDVRFESFRRSRGGSPEEAVWLVRLRSEWCLHWACEESTAQWMKTPKAALLQHLAEEDQSGDGEGTRYTGGDIWGTAEPTGFMNTLLACKRM